MHKLMGWGAALILVMHLMLPTKAIGEWSFIMILNTFKEAGYDTIGVPITF
jgi:hypothetical protein